MVALGAAVIRSGVEEGTFRTVDPVAVSRAVLFATARFHHPVHAEWADPAIDAVYDDAFMLLRLRTIVLLVLASLPVNAATVTCVIITKEAARSPAVNVAAVDQIQTTNPSGSTDLRSVGGAQKQTGETRRELEESLKTYRDLAKEEPETYLPHVAATLNDLGILDGNQNRIGLEHLKSILFDFQVLLDLFDLRGNLGII